MGKETSTERPRRSRSRPVTLTTDRYGRRVRDRDEKERGYKRRDFARDDSRERRDMISIRRGRGREDSREREWNDRQGTEEAYSYNRRKLDGYQPESSESQTSPQTQGKHWQDSATQRAHSDGKIYSRWSKISQNGHVNIVNDESGKIDQSNGGVYGPADRNGGVGGRFQWNGSPRDESWVEFRLKLRAEAVQPRGVWNTSPSPPRRKVVKVTEVDKVKSSSVEISGKIQSTDRRKKVDSKYVQRRSSSTNLKKSERKLRKTLPPTASSDSDDGSNGSESDSSSGSSSSSSSGSSSDSSSHSESLGSDSSGDECANPKKTSGKRKKRPLPTKTGSRKPKDSIPVSHVSSDPSLGDLDMPSSHKLLKPNDELDELDAVEAAEFKAEVQGHRHHGLHEMDSGDEAGPMPVPQLDELQGEGDRGVNYGGALLPGEGAAIAQFVQKGLRIPRRGEVGWAGQEIEKLESSGYVMSGSRHARMNAVRLRKENQVFNAEERRALALIMFEEKQQKENEILGNFRQMLTESNREGEKKTTESASST